MNAFSFSLKRAFHSSLRLTRSLIAAFGLTAARFDMLFAIRRPCEEPNCRFMCCGVMQRDLVRTLGVSAPTVSRMLRSLEKLGLVVRERLARDTRQLRVFLTSAGRARVDDAYAELECSGAIELAYECALSPPCSYSNTWALEGPRFEALMIADDVLNKIRHAFRDRATLHYPWHPDD